MKKFIITLAVLLSGAALAPAQQPTREQMEAMIAQMPQLPVSSEVRIGHLDNGLTYYIRHNALPEGRAEFYLATDAGAILEEQPSQDGLAHFLEHMCFNGTEHFPGKGILDYLRSIGAEFGRNINASTGFEETQYMLNNIPVQREGVVDTCLMILCDYSHYVLNEPAEIDAERGVIIEERRQRRNAEWRSMEKSLPIFFGPEDKKAICTLIGTQEHLETFKYESIVEFYHTWYHPGRQAVIVVGDVDVDRTEQRIKDIFGVVPAKENALPKPIQTIADHSEPRVGIITDPEASNVSVELIWHDEAMPEAINSTPVGLMTDIIKSIMSMVMRERFSDITSKPDSPYLSGYLGITDLIYEDIEAVMGSVTLKEDDILGGLKAFYTELVRLQRYGVTTAEFNRAKADYLTMMENRVKRASTRQNDEFVRPMISHFFDKQPLMEPADQLEIVKMVFGQLNETAINQTAAQLFGPKNFVMVYDGPEKEGLATPTTEQLLSVIAEVNASEISAPEGEEIPEAFLNPDKLKGAKVKKSATTIFDATEWTLANGVVVTVYPTELAKDQILFNLSKDGGLSLVSDEDLASFDDNVFSLFRNNSGVSSFSGTTVSKMLTGKSVSVNPYFSNLSHGISGRSTVKDLETGFQLLYLYYTDPRFDKEEWDNGIKQLEAVLPNLASQPDYKLQVEMYKTLFNSPRHELISEAKLAKADLAVVEKNWKALFKDAAGAKLVIVGDVNPEAIKPLVEKYIGSLPKGKKALSWKNNNDGLVRGKVENVFTADMQTPKSTVLQVWSVDTPFTHEKDAALDAISYILDMRYVNTLREEEGGTYGASANCRINRRPEERAMIQVYFDCKPALCDKLREIAIKVIKDLAENGPTEEEVTMAKLNLQKNLPESRQRNQYWMSGIQYFNDYGENVDVAGEAAIEALTPAAVQAAVKEFVSSENFIELVMKPAASAEAE